MTLEDFFTIDGIIKLFAVIFSIFYLIYSLFFLQQVVSITKVIKDTHNPVISFVTYLQILLAALIVLYAIVVL